MVAGVRVDIKDALIISALNTPGGGVFDWRNETERLVLAVAFATSPVNDPLNTLGAGHAPPGEYKASWVTRRQGNGHRVGFQIENFADHADIVEFGRHRSSGFERFSWRSHTPPGSIRVHSHGTRARDGRHVLRNAVNAVMPRQCDGYAPLV